MGSVQPASIIVIRMVSVFVLIQILMWIEWLVGVVGVANPPWNPDRRHVHARSRLVRIPLGKVIIEQRLGALTEHVSVAGRISRACSRGVRHAWHKRSTWGVSSPWYVATCYAATGRTAVCALSETVC